MIEVRFYGPFRVHLKTVNLPAIPRAGEAVFFTMSSPFGRVVRYAVWYLHDETPYVEVFLE